MKTDPQGIHPYYHDFKLQTRERQLVKQKFAIRMDITATDKVELRGFRIDFILIFSSRFLTETSLNFYTYLLADFFSAKKLVNR